MIDVNLLFRKSIANSLTLLNMFLGFLSIGLILQGDPIKAGFLIIIAAVLDVFDGKIARRVAIPFCFCWKMTSLYCISNGNGWSEPHFC